MGRSTFLKLTAVCLISSTVPPATALSAAVRAAHMMGLFERDVNSCPTSSTTTFTACNKPGLPSNFCCPSSTNCNPFNDNHSAICCPTGKDCSTISTISCDLTKQNATAYPTSLIYTTNLSGVILPSCNGACCPQGYECQGSDCVLVSAPSSTRSASAPSSTSSATNTPTSSSVVSTVSTFAPASGSNNSVAIAHCNAFPPTAVIAGFFPGVAAGILLALAGMCLCGHRSRKERTAQSSPDISSVAASISDPIYNQGNGRNEFLRRQRTSGSSRTSRVRSLFSTSGTMRGLRSRNAPVDGIGRSIPPVPQTPVAQRSPESSLHKEPSMESIKIYSPPDQRLRPDTTFTDMMTNAGFKTGDPFVPTNYMGSPGRVDPRSRDIGGV